MSRYNAEISAGSLMPLESRRIAALLQTNPSEAAWIQAVEIDNILQKRTPATARRQARLIKRRLTTLDPEAWKLIVERDSEVSMQLLLAASVKHSQLLGDFLLNVYAHRQRRLELARRSPGCMASGRFRNGCRGAKGGKRRCLHD